MDNMLDWLNHYAAAVQALASVCSVLATFVLLMVTRQYVVLTQEIARAAREQLRFQQRTVESESAQLMTLIDVFLGSLKHFPAQKPDVDGIRALTLWKHADVTTFGSLAAAVLGPRPEVQRAIQRLNWLHSTAEKAQQLAKDNAERVDEIPWDDWQRQMEEARTSLQMVRGQVTVS